MANYKSTITDVGAEKLTNFLANGLELVLFRAGAGDGVSELSQNTLTALVNPLEIDIALADKEYINGEIRLSIQISNYELLETVYIREIGIYALDENGQEFLFAYSWLDGEDSDNIIPISQSADIADTIHVHDVAFVITNQENTIITVNVGGNSYVTEVRMMTYAAPMEHNQPASTVTESIGATVEEHQREQDYAIQGLREQLDTGFTGTTVIHAFVPEQLPQWKGYDGSGLPEGVLDTATNRLYL